MPFKNLILTYVGKEKIGKRRVNKFYNEKGQIFHLSGKYKKGTTYQFRALTTKEKDGTFSAKKITIIGIINNRDSIKKRLLEKNRMLDVSETAGINFKIFADEIIRKMENRILFVSKKSPSIQFSLGKNVIDKGMEKMTLNFKSTFDDYVRATQHSLAFNYSLPFENSELAALSARKSPIINDMIIRSTRLKAELKQKLLQNIGQGLPVYRLVKALKESYPGFSQHIGTLVNTGLQRLYKDGTYAKTKQHFNKFRYAGPKDSANREYCAAHVGKIYEGAAADEQQSIIMNFYNCRHQMEPVID